MMAVPTISSSLDVDGPAAGHTDIVLATINAGYAHASLGLRCLRASLGPLRDRCRLLEFDGRARPETVAEAIARCSPRVCGLGAYIWNSTAMARVVPLLRAAMPRCAIVLGGPELDGGPDRCRAADLADCTVHGEGETVFRGLCEAVLYGAPLPRRLNAPPASVDRMAGPEEEYADNDLRHRIVYLESSRGCPNACVYCLSAARPGVRFRPIEQVETMWTRLLARGARRIKVVDRTFNADPQRAARLLLLFARGLPPDGVVQVEMVPSRLDGALMDAIHAFRPGALRVEVGVQTFNPLVARRIGRRPDSAEAERVIRALRAAGAVVHADLIAGLPGETPASFAAGFDRLLSLQPDELQVNILKRLPGAPLDRHAEEWGMVFDRDPPYAVIETPDWPAGGLLAMRRFERYWELLHNRGRFRRSLPIVWSAGPSPFLATFELCERLHERLGRTHSIAPEELAAAMLDHAVARGIARHFIAAALRDDLAAANIRPPRPLRS